MALLLSTAGNQTPFVLLTSGEPRERLKPVQEAIGGYVEVVPTLDGRVLLCDEDGLLKKRELNEGASLLAGRRIVGDVLVCEVDEVQRWDS
jgi:hypothetical protein